MGRFRLRVRCRQTFLDFENYLVTADRIKEAAEETEEAQQDADVSGPGIVPRGFGAIGRTPSGNRQSCTPKCEDWDPADGDGGGRTIRGGSEIDNDDEPIRAIAGYKPDRR